MHEQSTAAAAESRPLHPLAIEAARLLVMSEGQLVLPRDAATRVKAALRALFESSELEWAVRSLLIAASRLDAKGAFVAANTLVNIASSASREIWKLVSVRLNERRSADAGKVERLLGRKRQPAPRFTPPPSNAVRVGALFSSPRRA